MARLKYQRWLPKLIITHDMLHAFANNDRHMLHVLINWRPWEFSPLDDFLGEPLPSQMSDPHGDLRQRSWWRALALREKLIDLVEREGIKPALRGADLSEVR
jgi:hypothetical protein